ncbi:uncharacterized protein LOC126802555 [Argentina anserina]|uniref:uncharacterized protein LOC126802555 n=1 Tax=Argentina anserina TaxID=57926 RepID=UPI002176513D|nr:uncharacterized protein LOC126802555 [Potentilla anserina]
MARGKSKRAAAAQARLEDATLEAQRSASDRPQATSTEEGAMPSPPLPPPLGIGNTVPSPPPPPSFDDEPELFSSSTPASGDTSVDKCCFCAYGNVRKRGIVVSNKTEHIVKVMGHRLTLQWSDFHSGPHLKNNRSLLSHDIGCCVKARVPMLAPTFYELQLHQRKTVDNYLKTYYDIPASDMKMWNFIDRLAYERYKDWKHDCKRHFNLWKDEVPLEFVHRPDQWSCLCQHFRDPDYMAMCVQNQANRTKNPNPINHCSGSLPMSFRASAYLERGHPAAYVAGFLDSYLPSKNGKEKAVSIVILEKVKRKLDDILAENGEADPGAIENEPIPVDEQVDMITEVMGERKGTRIIGVGAALQQAPKRRGGAWTDESNERVRRAKEKADQAELQNQETREEIARIKEENQAFRDRLQALEAMIVSMQASQAKTT